MIIFITFFVSTFTEKDQLRLHDKPVAAKVLRVLAVQSSLITVLIGAVLEGVHGESWELTLGVLLFSGIGNGSTCITSTIKTENSPEHFFNDLPVHLPDSLANCQLELGSYHSPKLFLQHA